MAKPITPDIWGPHLWKSIHFIALAYSMSPSDQDKLNYKNFFTSIQTILPCSLCSNNYARHLLELPLTDEVIKNKETLLKWTIDMHNKVNEETGKPTYTFEQGLDMILNNFESKNAGSKDYIKFKEKKSEIKEENNGSIFTSVFFWLVIFAILIGIAVMYKKQ
jgi:hypothetical protein